MHTPDLMNKLEIGAFLGVSRAGVDRLIGQGLPAEADEHGRQRFSPAAVARWLLLRAECATADAEAAARLRLLTARAEAAEERTRRQAERRAASASRLVF